MTAQKLLSSVDKYSDAINLLESTFKKSKTVTSSNQDIQLALKTLKSISQDVVDTANTHLSSYDKILRERERVEEEDNFAMNNRLGTTRSLKKEIVKYRVCCKQSLDASKKVKPAAKNRSNIKRSARSQYSLLKIKKQDKMKKKTITFPKPDVGEEYAPTELCEKLMKHVDVADRRFVIKHLHLLHYIPVKFNAVLKHLHRYKNGEKLP